MAGIFFIPFYSGSRNDSRKYKLLIAIAGGLQGYVLVFDKNNMLLLYGSNGMLTEFRGEDHQSD